MPTATSSRRAKRTPLPSNVVYISEFLLRRGMATAVGSARHRRAIAIADRLATGPNPDEADRLVRAALAEMTE